MYRHTQVGRFAVGFNILLALIFIVMALTMGSALALIPVAIVAVLVFAFGSMTVEVDEHAMRFRFGRTGWGKEIPRSAIVAVTPTQSKWWEGIGIRFTTRGMLYNVASGPAVELQLSDGKRLRVGTDEPDRVAAVLENRAA
jgi:hypothetical protein